MGVCHCGRTMKKLSWQKKKDQYGFPYYVMVTPLECLIVESWTESYCRVNGSNVYGSPMPYDIEHNTPLVWTYNKCASIFKDADSAKAEAFKLYKEKVAQTLEALSDAV